MQIFRDINTFDDFIAKVREYQVQLITIILLALLVIGGTSGYLYYKRSREENAYRALVMGLEYFDAEIKKADEEKDDLSFLDKKEFETEEAKWKKVDEVFDKAYKVHSNSGIASFFLVYRSQALAKLKKLPEATKILREAISKMHNDHVKDYFMAKLALMLFDVNDGSSALQILKGLAEKEDSVSQDLALFHLGEHYWNEKDFNEARNYWNQLVLNFDKKDKYESKWVDAAKEKLRLIDHDVE